jgi:hypothetical protein
LSNRKCQKDREEEKWFWHAFGVATMIPSQKAAFNPLFSPKEDPKVVQIPRRKMRKNKKKNVLRKLRDVLQQWFTFLADRVRRIRSWCLDSRKLGDGSLQKKTCVTTIFSCNWLTLDWKVLPRKKNRMEYFGKSKG